MSAGEWTFAVIYFLLALWVVGFAAEGFGFLQAFRDVLHTLGFRQESHPSPPPMTWTEQALDTLKERYASGGMTIEELEALTGALVNVDATAGASWSPASWSQLDSILEKAGQWNKVTSTASTPATAAPEPLVPDPDSYVELVDGSGRVIDRIPTRFRPVAPPKPEDSLRSVLPASRV